MFRRFLLALALTLAAVPLAAPAEAAEVVVDNSDPSVQVRGNWTTSQTTSGYYGPDYRFRTAGEGSATVTWPFPANPA